jgi:hypothetical protein
MKRTVLALALLSTSVLAGSAAAQSYYQKENTLYAEFFGWGGEASANFEKLIGGRVGIRAGIGFTGLVFADGIAVPFGVDYLLGSDRNFLELGIGGSYIDFDEADPDKAFFNVKEDQVVLTGSVGYRFIGHYGFSYRLAFTPAIAKDGFEPMGGAAFGYSF